MGHDQHDYHRDRERHCREMAEHANDPDIRRRHEELAELHADARRDESGADPRL